MSEKFNPIIIQAPQLSREWFDARLGNVTGSKVSKTVEYYVPTKEHMTIAYEFYALNEQPLSEDSDFNETLYLVELATEYPIEFCLKAGVELIPTLSRETYKRQVVAERITGLSADADMFITKAMLWGQVQERYAKEQYKGITGNHLEDAPLMLHPKLLCGASPDGLVIDTETGELGNLEAKCLEPWNHLYKIIRANKMPDEHIAQVQMQMWINGRDWCDFVGYDPRVKEGLRVFIKRIERDNFYIDEVLVPGITRFLEECDQDERQFYAIMKSRVDKERFKIMQGAT